MESGENFPDQSSKIYGKKLNTAGYTWSDWRVFRSPKIRKNQKLGYSWKKDLSIILSFAETHVIQLFAPLVRHLDPDEAPNHELEEPVGTRAVFDVRRGSADRPRCSRQDEYETTYIHCNIIPVLFIIFSELTLC